MKIKELPNIDPETGKPYHHRQFLYWCEGCGYEHAFALRTEGGHHGFNMDLDNPTVTPSLLENHEGRVCHSFINNGMIQYLGDCHHHLKGQTIELPDVDAKLAERKKRK